MIESCVVGLPAARLLLRCSNKQTNITAVTSSSLAGKTSASVRSISNSCASKGFSTIDKGFSANARGFSSRSLHQSTRAYPSWKKPSSYLPKYSSSGKRNPLSFYLGGGRPMATMIPRRNTFLFYNKTGAASYYCTPPHSFSTTANSGLRNRCVINNNKDGKVSSDLSSTHRSTSSSSSSAKKVLDVNNGALLHQINKNSVACNLANSNSSKLAKNNDYYFSTTNNTNLNFVKSIVSRKLNGLNVSSSNHHLRNNAQSSDVALLSPSLAAAVVFQQQNPLTSQVTNMYQRRLFHHSANDNANFNNQRPADIFASVKITDNNSSLLASRTSFYSTSDEPSSPSSEAGVTLTFERGLPHLTVPLPSRRELCRFPLRPVTHTVACLTEHLASEDRGIDRVIVRTTEGVRVASSASIESLLLNDFDLIINDVTYRVTVPHQHRSTMEEVTELDDVRQLVSKLYSALHVDEHQIGREREIVQQIEDIREQLIPMDKHRIKLVSASERRSTILMYSGLAYMALQFGFLARLTWWEYSWDIMEPVTYFVTYGTAIACYAYYVLTKHDFILPEVRDRQFLLGFHRKARKTGMDVSRYNHLKDKLFALETDLQRLRDPLQLNLPPQHLAKVLADQAQAQGGAISKTNPLYLIKSFWKSASSAATTTTTSIGGSASSKK